MKAKPSPKTPSAEPQPWVVLRFNHFDPTWRRCWDRAFSDEGRRFASYRAIEDRWIADAIAGNRALAAIPANQATRYGMTVERTALRAFPTFRTLHRSMTR